MGVKARDHDDASSEHDGHIRDIENAGSQWPEPNVHEVDDLSIGDAIQEVGRASGYEQSHTEERRYRPSRSGPGRERCSTCSWWRKANTSNCRMARERTQLRRVNRNERRTDMMTEKRKSSTPAKSTLSTGLIDRHNLQLMAQG